MKEADCPSVKMHEIYRLQLTLADLPSSFTLDLLPPSALPTGSGIPCLPGMCPAPHVSTPFPLPMSRSHTLDRSRVRRFRPCFAIRHLIQLSS